MPEYVSRKAGSGIGVGRSGRFEGRHYKQTPSSSGGRVTRLADIAPRLALARDQWIAEAARLREEQSAANRRWLKARWLVEHRDLQLVRALATGKSGYIGLRQRKLEAARREMAQAEARLERVARERLELAA